MDTMANSVRRHYEAATDNGAELIAAIRQFLDGMKHGPLSTAQLAGFDQFHVRGLAATAELGRLLDLRPDLDVLDAGSGLGGPSRYLAETYGCSVSGIDLAPTFIDIARLLADRAGMGDRIDYVVGDLLALPFTDKRFDVVYTQHVVMNIRDRGRAYREIRRVLKPGGRFAFYDVLATDGRPQPYYPVPWAESGETSFLLTVQETKAALAGAGLEPEVWNDVTAEGVSWFGQLRPPAQGPSLATIMGGRFGQMSANFARNLLEDRVRLVMGVFR